MDELLCRLKGSDVLCHYHLFLGVVILEPHWIVDTHNTGSCNHFDANTANCVIEKKVRQTVIVIVAIVVDYQV